jgi:glutathione S-transferase
VTVRQNLGPRYRRSPNVAALEQCSAALNACFSAMEAPLLIESTQSCRQTPRLLLLLEEIDAPYTLTLRPAGHFLATYGRPGPRLIDGDLTLFDCTTMLRHCARTHAEAGMVPRSLRDLARVDSWLDLSNLLGSALVGLAREESEQADQRRPTRIAEGRALLGGMLALVERALEDSDGDWLLGDFGLADCAMASLPMLARLVNFERWPRVRAYCERLAMRPAASRAQAMLASEQTG